MPQPLVRDSHPIRLAMIGMVAGNGHPYSWSAIINGRYDAAAMAKCGYPVIPQYLGAQPREDLGIDGVAVTHIWCDQRSDADQVARAAFIDHVVDHPEEVIGKVDAVVIPTDIGGEHVNRARPFIDAGLPVFIDKPLTDNEDDLRQFVTWWNEGRAILSTSCMRYAREFTLLRDRLPEAGEPRLIVGTMMKNWERYGIHALEMVYGLLAPGGWVDVVNSGSAPRNIIHLRHQCGVDVVLTVIEDLAGAFGHVSIAGTDSTLHAQFTDPYTAFKRQLQTFIDYLRQGVLPFPCDQTIEQMKIIIAGIRSRDQGGRRIALSEIHA